MKNQYFILIFLFSIGQAGFSQSDNLSKDFFKSRRDELRKMLPDSSFVVIFSASEKVRANDVEYLYHQDPDFYYMSGFNEPHAILLIFKEARLIKNQMVSEILFLNEKNPDQEVWTGRRLGVIGAKKVLGFNTVYTLKDLAAGKINFALNPENAFVDGLSYSPEKRNEDENMDKAIGYLRDYIKPKSESKFEDHSGKIQSLISGMREVKLNDEVILMQKAIDITCKAQMEAMKSIDTSMYEYHVQAFVEYVFRANGSEYTAFPSIVGSGENTCILHYTENNKKLKNGELIVIDIGAEYHGYAADVTRTIPVNGKFSDEQKLIYQLVYDAQKAGIEASLPGNSFSEPGKKATEIIASGLKKLGIIEREKDVRKYFIHGTSHYVGLDVHDAGTYGKLRSGNIITVEPGIYIPAGSPCDQKWWNIGVRIEDDVLITETGFQVMSSKAPSTIAEIEIMMKEKGGSIFYDKKH